MRHFHHADLRRELASSEAAMTSLATHLALDHCAAEALLDLAGDGPGARIGRD